jgi:VanZ family protein
VTRRLVPWLPAIAWAAVIFLLSAQSRLPVDLAHQSDKLVHFLAYALLGALLARGQSAAAVPAVVAMVLGVVYGASDEWHQSFVPGRSVSAVDWLADSAGAIAGVYFYHWLHRRARGSAIPRPDARPDSRPS